MSVAIPGWCMGTALGVIFGEILPGLVVNCLSVALYGMFIAIIIPPAKKNHKVLIVLLIAAALSVVMHYLLPMISSGFAIIIAAVISSVIGTLFFPVSEQDRGEAAE